MLCVPADSPVRAPNHGVGKCLATNWSAGSPLLLALAGWAPVKLETSPEGATRFVGLVTGLLLAMPGYPHCPSSRPGTVSLTPGVEPVTYDVAPVGWAPPRSWA